MIQNRFVFIVPFRNVKDYIKKCSDTIIGQDYKNWIAIFCDDESNDKTSDYITPDPRFKIRRNNTRTTALLNIHNGIVESSLDDNDIICILDGDDFLIRPDVLDIINKMYQDQTLLSYGQYVWPNGQIGHCAAYTRESFDKLRTGGYWASHMRTFKYSLYKELLVQDPDLLCYKDSNGNFYQSCYDVAIMTPLMEMAGFDRIKFNPEPVYFYRIHQQNDHFVDPVLQKNIADEIFSKKKFNLI